MKRKYLAGIIGSSILAIGALTGAGAITYDIIYEGGRKKGQDETMQSDERIISLFFIIFYFLLFFLGLTEPFFYA